MTQHEAHEVLVEKVASAIRNATCETPTYPRRVFDSNEARANINEWSRYAARAVVALAAEMLETVTPEMREAGYTAYDGSRQMTQAWLAMKRASPLHDGGTDEAV